MQPLIYFNLEIMLIWSDLDFEPILNKWNILHNNNEIEYTIPPAGNTDPYLRSSTSSILNNPDKNGNNYDSFYFEYFE